VHENVFENPEQLMAFLQGMAENKVLQLHRHELDTLKKDRHRQVSLDAYLPAENLVDPRPAPEQLAISQEAWDRWLSSVPQPQRRLVELLRSGWTQKAIAEHVGVCERTIRRLLRRVPPLPPELQEQFLLDLS
jgi:DNA-directed RNA polymerase specialized sigma24 family protein